MQALGAELEAALRQVVRDYHAFLTAGPQGDPKAFAAYHAACRAALSHIDQLLKLLRGTAEPGGEAQGRDALAREAAEILAETRGAMAAAAGLEPEEEEEQEE